MALTFAYFLTAGLTVFVVSLMATAHASLRLGRDFLVAVILAALVGAVSVLQALLYACPPLFRYAPMFLGLEQAFKLSFGFPVMLMAMGGRKTILRRIVLNASMAILGILVVIALSDGMFGLELLFTIEIGSLKAQPLYAFLFAPVSMVVSAGTAILVVASSRAAPPKRVMPMRALGAGLLCLFPFEAADAILYSVKPDLLAQPLYAHNAGAVLFCGFLTVFALGSIRAKIQAPALRAAPRSKPRRRDEEERILEEIYAKALDAMRSRKLFIDPDISLEYLAARLHESERDVSRAVNRFFGDNVYHFLNYFRVEEMKRLLSIAGNDETIVETGIRAGFNSRTSINRAFYRYARMSPAAYMAQARHT